MEISFAPSPDVIVILNALLDKFENRAKRNTDQVDKYTGKQVNNGALSTLHFPRSIKISLTDLPLPTYSSQTDPEPRAITNRQLQTLEKCGYLNLIWLPGESGHLLQAITLKPELHPEQSRREATRSTQHDVLYKLIQRTPISDYRARLESLLLAEKFRYPKDDWRAHALNYILGQLRTGKSPSPFSLSDSNLNLDLLAVLQALPALTAEIPYRVFSVRVFNDTKRFEAIKSHIVSLARLGNPEWKRIPAEEVLRELNLVANPNYIHLSGNWQLTTENGEILELSGFTPSIGFPAAQISTLKSVRAVSVLCIENLTTFHQEVDRYTGKHVNSETRNISSRSNAERTHHAVICTYGNPSPAIRHILRLLPKSTSIYLWSDMDYGGFNILAQLRRQVSPRIQPYLMDIATFDKHAQLSRPLTQSDVHNLKRLTLNPVLADVHSTIHNLLNRGLKLEQEAIQI